MFYDINGFLFLLVSGWFFVPVLCPLIHASVFTPRISNKLSIVEDTECSSDIQIRLFHVLLLPSPPPPTLPDSVGLLYRRVKLRHFIPFLPAAFCRLIF